MTDEKPSCVPLASGGLAYAFTVVAFVAAAHARWIPGVDTPTEGLLGAYRLAVALFCLCMAVWLGIGAAAVGRASGKAWFGFVALVFGGFLTGVALSFAPWILYPHDRYSPAFTWLLLGGPVGLVSWMGSTVARRREDREG